MILFKIKNIYETLFLKLSITLAGDPVQLIRIIPITFDGCAKPNLAHTLAPAPSPRQITYFTCKKFNTDTRSSPRTWSVGNWNLYLKTLSFLSTKIFFSLFSSLYKANVFTIKKNVILMLMNRLITGKRQEIQYVFQ